MSQRLAAPAKVNFGLRVVGRRADGYHLLESLFVPLALGDELRLAVRPAAASRVALELCDPTGQLDHDPDPGRNLATRAARSFLEASGLDAAVEIQLRKQIPAGAGLGGGSSDAGAVLRGLAAALPDARLSGESLSRLALALGADVPFFLDPRPAWVSGIGEEIEPAAPLPPVALLLATPRPALSTALVFQRFAALHPELTPDPPRRRIRASRGERERELVLRLGGGAVERADDDPLRNDLEPVAVALRPEIARLRETMLSAGARAAAMSGSGPSVFGVFESREAAAVARDRVEWAPGTQVHVSATLH